MSRPPASSPGSPITSSPFPIRTSQSQRRGNPSTTFPYAVPSDHQLRRKTPSGTIEAAYDGSFQPPIPSGPPPKQMILPSPDNPTYPSPSDSNWQPKRQATAYGSEQQPIPTDNHSYAFMPQQELWQRPRAVIYPFNLLSPQPAAPIFNNPPAPFSNSYQPVIRANEHNMRAFCPPPPLPSSETIPFGHSTWQPGYPGWNQPSGGNSIPAQRGSRFPGIMGTWPYTALHPEFRPFKMDPSQPPYENAPLPPNIASLSLEPLGGRPSNPGFQPQPRFKEKALRGAHEAYVDLLAFIDSMRRGQPGRANSDEGAQFSPRLMAFPKAPNPHPFNAGSPAGNSGAEPVGSGYGQGPGGHYDVEDGGSSLTATPGADYSTLGSATSRGSPPGQAFFGDVHPPVYPEMPHSTPLTFPNYGNETTVTRRTHPVTKATFSLDVMTSLCEQDGYRWAAGMLIVGCLHYALGNYLMASDSFMKVINADPSNVVAITNLASSLFCLDRQAEAERQWLNAIRLCPSYLEAAEHLVGLLYRKRSPEAIEVVTFIQQALKLPGSSSNPAAGSEQPPASSYELQRSRALDDPPHGFGSSGYALPGSENGRMLALVHVKGTLLYSLKNVSRASKAFEEAVLISIGRRIDSIRHLVRRVQNVLNPHHQPLAPGRSRAQHVREPLLLPPEKARQTASLVFSDGGELPGLTFVALGAAKRAATATTSNSLLSLAKIYQDAMASGPSGASFLGRPTGVGDILALYYLSLSLQESPSTANNVGILLAGIQQPASSQRPDQTFANGHAPVSGAPPGSGLSLALSYYQYGLRLDPRHVHLHTNLGSLLKDIGQLDFAIQMYEQAVACDGTFDIALTNLANAVKDRGRINEAIEYYRRAVRANPDFAEAVCGLFTALNSVCDWKGRGGTVSETGNFDRWHVSDDGSLVDVRSFQRASGLAKQVTDIVHKQLEEASRWGCDVLQDDVIDVLVSQMSDIYVANLPGLRRALREWRGKPWEGTKLLRLVERAVRVKLRQFYYERYVSGIKWIPQYRRPKLPAALSIPSAPTVLPFHTFTSPLGPKTIRSISQLNAARISVSTLKSSWLPSTLYPPPAPPEPQLNVGYLSSDFNNHPLAHLMQSVFGFHAPRRVRAFCYATTASDRSIYRRKIEREAPVFRDVSAWSPDKVADQIAQDQIHILVNLNGYTRGARNEIFAARLAPLQMSFMGFAGTLGSEWCDYILADTTAVPPSTLRPYRNNSRLHHVFEDYTETTEGDWVYSENIIFCRDTFFCCDHAQSADPNEGRVTWEGEQTRRWRMRKEIFPSLSDDTIILGNFNQLYKIDPTIFRTWLRILARAPKAVLWLLKFPELGEANLRATAERWAGPEVAARLIFTEVAPKGQHIARARVCDLFLDTPECNAHTTAADVLWSSTPILTLPRYPYKMCSRIAASILKGALPKCDEGKRAANELIVEDEDEYESRAVALANGLSYTIQEQYGEGHGRLADLRKLLWDSRWSCALFDTRRWVHDLEDAYDEAWRRWVTGEQGDIYL